MQRRDHAGLPVERAADGGGDGGKGGAACDAPNQGVQQIESLVQPFGRGFLRSGQHL